MSEPENIDDELLSAYLDDELALEERARVEQRLASDPAARQLLEQLRAVSHAVKELPTEPIGADIRDTVLRRAERAMLISNPKGSAAGDSVAAGGDSLADLHPRLTIGRSIRGWVWAGLATAAGLAIVAFESSSNRDAQLPDTVAQRAVEAVDQAKPAPDAGTVAMAGKQDAPAEPAAPAPQAIVAAPQASTPAASDLATDKSSARGGEDRYGESAASASSFAARREFDNESLAGGRGGAASASNTAVGLLVVHVDVKPEAYEQRAFDRVLARNGITIEDSANDESKTLAAKSELSKDALPQLSARGAAPTNAPASQSAQVAAGRLERQLSDGSAATENTDLVLVEAPAAQIQSCLEELRRDDHNYAGVAVDEDQTDTNQTVTESLRDAPAAKENWGQYNRGTVSQQQKVQRSPDNSLYYSTGQGPVMLNRGANLGVDAQQTEQLLSRDKNATNLSNERGRAMRMRSQSSTLAEQQNTDNNARAMRLDSLKPSSPNAESNFGFANRDAKELPSEKAVPAPDETVQVLFVLRAGEAQAAAPPANEKASKQ
jgi:anti-sigma factor RsiW